jgi:hypothetical protein
MPTLLVHLMNEDPVLGDVDALPEANDNFITLHNPRRRDGKDLPNIETSVTSIIFPVFRITYIEVIPTGEEEEIIGFVRE